MVNLPIEFSKKTRYNGKQKWHKLFTKIFIWRTKIMKMTKLLASGVAAALATTSLAAIGASAAERSFEMGHTQGTIKTVATSGQEVDFLADKDGLAPATLGISADDVYTINVANATKKVTGVNLKVTGIKGSKSSSSRTYTYAFTNYAADGVTQTYGNSGPIWKLNAYASTAPVDSFVPSQFVEVTQISMEIACEETVTTAAEYDAWGSSNWGSNLEGMVITPFDDGSVANGSILAAINGIINVGWGGAYAAYSEKSTTDLYPFMGTTAPANSIITRQQMAVLSVAGAWTAQTGGQNSGTDGDQTYDEVEYNKGTNPNDFAGLASQVGDFFNKQTNGTITFTFTTSSGATSTAWNNGGVPSSQVGIKNALGDATANDFVLNFNYSQTGSLQAVAAVDAAAGEVSFDISDILDALDGKTMGVIDNIYYGMTKGVAYTGDHPYSGKTGFEVQKITLAYDEDDTNDTDIEEDDDDDDDTDDDTDVSDDDDDDDDDTNVDDDDDDDDVSFDDDDDDDDDSNVGGSVVTPGNNGGDDDGNPNTGVALAVVPAMVAAAAVVVSKKRK